MTQPYPPQPPQLGAPPQYGQQPPAYGPPQGYPQPQQPGYPVAPPPGPQYAQQPQTYGYPAQQGGYPVQQPYAPVPALQPQLPSNPASLASFYEQPSSGWGPALQLGVAVQNDTSYIGVVAQWITAAHFEYAENTDPRTGQTSVRTFRNGQPVVNMKVPLNVVPDAVRYTDGRAQLYVGPSEKDLLNAAIAAGGGNPAEPPPLGSMIRATKTGQRGNRSGGQSAIKSFEYWPPEVAQGFAQQLGITYPDLNTPKPAPKEPRHAAAEATPAPAPAPVAPAPAVAAGPPVQQQAALPQPPVQQAPQYGPPQGGLPPAPAAPVPSNGFPGSPGVQSFLPPAPGTQQAGPPPGAPVPMPAPAAPAGMSPDKAALMAQLTGQAPLPAA